VAYAALLVWFVGPSVLLTVSGVLIFRRNRTAASALVAFGFAAVLIGGMANALTNYSAIYRSAASLAAAVPGWVWPLAGFCSYGGLWLASIGLLWEVLGTRRSAATGNRWRGS
jgi:hypothetical protein